MVTIDLNTLFDEKAVTVPGDLGNYDDGDDSKDGGIPTPKEDDGSAADGKDESSRDLNEFVFELDDILKLIEAGTSSKQDFITISAYVKDAESTTVLISAEGIALAKKKGIKTIEIRTVAV